MAKDSSGVMLRELQRLFEKGTVAGLSDPELLRRFADDRDEMAFTALVERHGPMVLGVCRRILRDPHRAEDVFQAAFLVLVRKAGSIRVDDSLARWLYTVTRRLALRVAAEASRRDRLEPCAAHSHANPSDDSERRELATVLHEELGRLPETYRNVVILCYLEGLTHEEAARRLRWPLGSVKGRLVRARGLLQSRLTRRGLAVSSGTLVLTLRPLTVSASLLEQTLTAAINFAAGRGGIIPAVTLANGVLMTMVLSKFKLGAAGLLAVAVGAYAMGAAIDRGDGTKPEKPAANNAPALGKPKMEQTHGVEVISADETQDKLQDLARQIKLLSEEFLTMISEIERPEAELKRLQTRATDNRNRFYGLHGQLTELREKRDQAKKTEPRSGRPASTPTRPAGSQPPIAARPAIEGALRVMPDYTVGPPDLLRIEALETLPARPIKGEYLVRPDGKISLGFYGEVYVAGLTTQEIKAKVILHLRKYLNDEALGLVGAEGKPIDPKDSTHVFVDVTSYNSKAYYVQGDVASPGRLPITGSETVLDAITFAGGVLPTGSRTNIKLVRPAVEGGGKENVLPIDLVAIIEKGDSTTNYQILSNDRLIVYRDPEAKLTAPPDTGKPRRQVESRIDALIKELSDLKSELGK